MLIVITFSNIVLINGINKKVICVILALYKEKIK